MKKLHFFCLASLLVLGWSAQGDALPIKFEGSSTRIFSNRQSVEVVIIDGEGHIYHQTLPYDSALGGVDINLGQIGPHSSIYFPELGVGYIWYNGQWVNQEGYSWDGRTRVYINDPNWKKYWVHYWQGNSYDKVRRGPWHQRTLDGRPRNEAQYGNHNDGSYGNGEQRDWREENGGREGQRGWDDRDRSGRPNQENWGSQTYSQENTWGNLMPGKRWENQPRPSNRSYPSFENPVRQGPLGRQNPPKNWESQNYPRENTWGQPMSGERRENQSSMSSWANQFFSSNRNNPPSENPARQGPLGRQNPPSNATRTFLTNDDQLSQRGDRPDKSSRWERQ